MNYIKRLIIANDCLAGIANQLDLFVDVLEKAARDGKTIFTCGNGGSASDADHISGELLKSFIFKRRVNNDTYSLLERTYGEKGIEIARNLEEGIRAIPIGSFQAFLSAYGNDVDWKMAYAQFLYVMGNKGDLMIGISCSGNAENVSNAFKIAKIKGIYTILLTGATRGKCAEDADLAIMVPEKETYRIQEYHSKIYHAVCGEVEKRIFGGKNINEGA